VVIKDGGSQMALPEDSIKKGYDTAQQEREAAKGFAREAGTRAEASAQELRGYLPRAQELETTGLKALRGSQQRQEAMARRDAALGIAGASQGGAFGGGAKGAALTDVAKKMGESRANIEAQAAMDAEKYKQAAMQQQLGISEGAGQAEVESSIQKLEGEKFAREAGTQEEDRQKKLRTYQETMSKIKADAKGDFWEDDDEEGAEKAIRDLAASESDPELKKVLLAEADRIKEEGFMAF